MMLLNCYELKQYPTGSSSTRSGTLII